MVSIIVPCYNQAHYLPDALDSIKAQTYENWECLIINDGSPDDVKGVVESYIRNDTRFKYLEKENDGVSSARNAGLHISQGKYILPLDADDKIGIKYLQEAVIILDNEPGTKLVYSDAEFFGIKKGKWILNDFSIQSLLLENMIFSTALFRRSAYEQLGGYDQDFKHGWEDWEYWIRILGADGKVRKLNDVHFYYRKNKNTRSEFLSNEKFWQGEMLNLLYTKHKALYDRFYGDPIQAFSERNILQSELEKVSKKLHDVYSSREFKIGKLLLKPFRLLKWTK